MLTGRKILVTGASGQVGYHVAKYLAQSNEVWGLARFSRPHARGEVEALGVKAVVCDYTSSELSQIPSDFEYVLHFAACTSPRDLEEGLRQNVEGTRLLLGHCRGAKAFLFVSTVGVYQRHADPFHLFEENDPVGGQTDYQPFYGVSKLAAEAVVQQLSREFHLPTTIARLNCTYSARGNHQLPGPHLDWLVHDRPVPLPKSRDLVHSPIAVEDVALQSVAMLQAAQVSSTIVNWGGDDAVTARQWVEYWAQLLGKPARFRFSDDVLFPCGAVNNEKRWKLVGRCTIGWKRGFHRMLAERYPRLPLPGVAHV
jgi:nucleoside-diphosphate-sugar epimerase